MKHILFVISLALLLSGCLSDSTLHSIDDFDTGNTNQHLISFTVRVPNMDTAQTRTMTAEAEREIQTVDILLFDSNNRYVYQPFSADAITISNTNSTFTTKLPEGQYTVVVLANARQSVINAMSNISAGMPKDEVVRQLIFINQGAWNTTAASFTRIPMWGELTLNINASTAAPMSHPIELIRMVAKIDVQIASSVNSFQLRSVRLYGANDRGQVAPDNAAQWRTTPSIPAGTVRQETPLFFTVPHGTQRLMNAIYTFETAAGSYEGLLKNTALVIGGRFGNDTSDTYYRIEFANGTDHVPLLRNHRYLVNVNSVSSRGYATPTEAFNSHPMNLEAQVVVFDNPNITDIVILDQYILGVSANNISLSNTHTSFNLLVYSNHPEGWKAKALDTNGNPSDCLTLSPASAPGAINYNIGSGTTTTMHITVRNNEIKPRHTIYIHLSVGRMTLVVRVYHEGVFIPEPHAGWAGSNIFWNGDYLTFDKVGAPIEYQERQGVYFQWGSLIARGARVGGTRNENWGNQPGDGIHSGGFAALYMPNGISGTAGTLHLAWGHWAQVTSYQTANRNRAFLYEITDGYAGIGDICRHLTSMGWAPGSDRGLRWRMPTSAEFEGSYTRVGTTWTALTPTATPAANLEIANAGRVRVNAGYSRTDNGVTTFFPASAFANAVRIGTAANPAAANAEGVVQTLRNNGGRYWSSSPDGTQAFGFTFTNATTGNPVSTANSADRREGRPVRCVLQR